MNETISPQSIIKRVVDELHMSVRAFASGMNEPYSKIFDIYSGRTKVIVPSVVKSISETYGVDVNFLRTGRGEVFVSNSPIPTSSDDLTNSFLRVIAAMSDENTKLKSRIEELERQLRERNISESLPPTNGNDGSAR